MMKPLTTVIFPETIPGQGLVPLVPVFDKVVYCQPVENDPGAFPASGELPLAGQHDLIGIHVPAPLEGDRERFLKLAGELQQSGDQFMAQLSHLTLASLSTGDSVASESRSALLSTLFSGGENQAEDGMRRKVLWQARLVLKLGEKLDADQRSLANDMHGLEAREQDLFAGLGGDQEVPFALTRKLAGSVPDGGSMQHLRLKAWSRLLALGTNELPECSAYVTADPGAVERLSEECEKLTGAGPVQVISLALPSRQENASSFGAARDTFHTESAEMREQLPEILAGECSPDHLRQFQERWEQKVDRIFPAEKFGSARLDFCRLSRVPVRRLFLESFGRDESAFAAELSVEPVRDICLGLVRGPQQTG